MTLTGRSSSDAFARALEGRATGDTDTLVLAALAARLEELPSALSVAPDPAYRDALRRRLLAVAAVQGVGATATVAPPAPAALADRVRSWGLARRTGRATALAAGGLAGVVAIAGVGTAGSRSLPGDPFYGVKTAAESVQLAAADGAYEEGVRHLQFADTRLREVRALAMDRPLALGPAAPGAPVAAPLAADDDELADLVGQALDNLDEHLRGGEESLVAAHEQGDGEEPLVLLAEAAASQVRGLRAVAAVLPDEVAERALESAQVAAEVEMSATALQDGTACDETCRPVPAPTTPDAPTPGTAPRPCGCPAPEPSTRPEQPTPSATSLPPATPTPSRSGSDRPTVTPTQQPSPEPTPTGPPLPVPTIPPVPTEPPTTPPTLPVPLPSDLPTSEPTLGGAARTDLPTVPALPLPLPTALPTLPTLGGS